VKKPEDRMNRLLIAAAIVVIVSSINIGFQLARILP